MSSSENNELSPFKCHLCETQLFFITAEGLRQHRISNHGIDQLDETDDSNDIGADDASSSSTNDANENSRKLTNDENENSRELSTLKRTSRARTRVQPTRKTRKTTNCTVAPLPNNEQPLMTNPDPGHHASFSSPSVPKNSRGPMVFKNSSRIRMFRKKEIAPEIYWPTYDPSLVPRIATPEPDEGNKDCHFEKLTRGANANTISFKSNSRGEIIRNSICNICDTEFEDEDGLINHLYQFHPHPSQSAWTDKGNPKAGAGIDNVQNIHNCNGLSGTCLHLPSDDYIFITVNENMG